MNVGLAQTLHQKALAVVARYKRSEIELVEILEELELAKTFYILGFSSLHDYAVQGLELSDAVAHIFINVARKTLEVPQLKAEIRSGAISVSKAVRLTAVMTKDNQQHWLTIAKAASKNRLEREVALASPEKAIRERASLRRFGKTVRVELALGVSEDLMLKLRRVQDVLSQKRGRNVDLEEALDVMTDLFLVKEDPVEKARRHKMRRGPVGVGPGKVLSRSASGRRRPLRVSLKHHVQLQHGGQCTHVDDKGVRCTRRRHLHIHHIRPLAMGGVDVPENLTLLCSGHHRAVHAHDIIDVI